MLKFFQIYGLKTLSKKTFTHCLALKDVESMSASPNDKILHIHMKSGNRWEIHLRDETANANHFISRFTERFSDDRCMASVLAIFSSKTIFHQKLG